VINVWNRKKLTAMLKNSAIRRDMGWDGPAFKGEVGSSGQLASFHPVSGSIEETKVGSSRDGMPEMTKRRSHREIGSGAIPSHIKWRAAKAPCTFVEESLVSIQLDGMPSNQLSHVMWLRSFKCFQSVLSNVAI
jgi:hypothetical protein